MLILCLSLIGCNKGPPVPPVDTTQDIAELVEKGMTLDEVYALMTAELRATTTIYPATDIQQKASGSWRFMSKEDGSPGDTDAPFLILFFIPDPIGTEHYTVFLENELVMEDDWFTSAAAAVIQKLLGGDIETEE